MYLENNGHGCHMELFTNALPPIRHFTWCVTSWVGWEAS